MWITSVSRNLADETAEIISLFQEALKLNFLRVTHMRCIWMRHHRNSTRQRPGALDTLNGQSDLFNKKCAFIWSDQWIKPTRRNNSRYRLWNIGIHNIYGVLCWLACPLPASVPMPDKLISVMDNIKKQNTQFSNSAMEAFRNHMHTWYLTEELVWHALFDKGLEDDTHRKLADAIVKCKDLNKSVNRLGLGNLTFPWWTLK